MNIGILDWTDENAKGDYPLLSSIGVKGVIVDASFVQFDGFVPVLNSITVAPTTVTFNITFDRITKNITVDNTTFQDTRFIRIYESDVTRFIGSLTLGQGFLKLFEENVGSTIILGISFASNTVVSINRKSGVYSFAGLIGDVGISTATVDDDYPIFFGVDGNVVICNAVGIPAIPFNILSPLKTINGVGPINNQIKIEDSEVLKISAGFNGLNFDLANSVLNDNIAPTQNYE